MKVSLLLFFSMLLNYNSITKVDIYNQAKHLIISSKEYADFKVGKKNYHVSEQIISFSNFSNFFESENNSDVNGVTNREVVLINKDLLSLNDKKCGKVKIFFSEQKNNVFFAEVILYKKKELSYTNRPSFGSSQIYMFTILDDKVILKDVMKMHYN